MIGKELFHIYGPLSINSYGVFILLGLLLFFGVATRHPLLKRYMSAQAFIDFALTATFVGIVTGRVLYAINEWNNFSSWHEAFALWNGGFSVLGTVIGLVIVMPPYMWYNKIPTLPIFDIAALHAPLIHAVARIGCFFAGCCYGLPTTMCWAFTYTTTNTLAPQNIPLHPTQLYSTVSMLAIFALMYFVLQKYLYKPGQLLCTYLMFISIERFCLDFFRGDVDYHVSEQTSIFSTYQTVAVGLFCAALMVFIGITLFSKQSYKKIHEHI